MGSSCDIALELNTVHQGDCIEAMGGMPSSSVDLVFADPPFNIGYEYDEYDDRLENEHYIDWSRRWIEQVYRVLNPSGAFWLAIGDEYAAELKIEAQRIGFHPRSWVVWYYTFGVHCRSKFTRSHAHLFHFVKDPGEFTFNVGEVAVPSARQLVYGDKRANPAGRTPDDTWILRPQDCVDGFTADEDTWYFPRVAGTFKERAGFHGCQMPEQLLGRIIRSCSRDDDLVLDPFAGSCTTLTVAKKEGRRFIGMELSKDYVKLGRQRIESVARGDRLDGSPEPKASAPATFSKQARRLSGVTPDERGFVHQEFDFVENAGRSDEIVEAFASANRGYSVDRLVADPLLNEDFQLQCERRSIPGTPAERNRFLFRLRKSGKLKQEGIETSRRTRFDWEDIDPFLYAAEIAWRRVAELYAGASLDDILCDPRLANEFDEIAGSWASGYRPLEYRWAALKLRKEGSKGRSRASSTTARKLGFRKFKESDFCAIDSFRTDDASNAAGVYGIRVRSGDFLYAGETCNLAARLELQLSEQARLRWPSDLRDPAELQIAVQSVPSVSGRRLACQSRLLRWYRPAWNFNELIALS